MSTLQVYLVMIAAGAVAYAAFTPARLHGARPRGRRHALAALPALSCVAAPLLAGQDGVAEASGEHLRRAATVALLGLGALASWLTLVGRRPASHDRASAAPAAPAGLLEAAASPTLAPGAVPGPDAGGTGPDELDLDETERRFRASREPETPLDLPEGGAWRTVTVGAAGDAALDGPDARDGRSAGTVAGGARAGLSATLASRPTSGTIPPGPELAPPPAEDAEIVVTVETAAVSRRAPAGGTPATRAHHDIGTDRDALERGASGEVDLDDDPDDDLDDTLVIAVPVQRLARGSGERCAASGPERDRRRAERAGRH